MNFYSCNVWEMAAGEECEFRRKSAVDMSFLSSLICKQWLIINGTQIIWIHPSAVRLNHPIRDPNERLRMGGALPGNHFKRCFLHGSVCCLRFYKHFCKSLTVQSGQRGAPQADVPISVGSLQSCKNSVLSLGMNRGCQEKKRAVLRPAAEIFPECTPSSPHTRIVPLVLEHTPWSKNNRQVHPPTHTSSSPPSPLLADHVVHLNLNWTLV